MGTLSNSATGDFLSSSMSYVSSCNFTSLSDCNVVSKKQQKISNKKKNNNKIMNTLLNSDNNKNKNNKVNTIGRSIIPSTIRQMFGGRTNNNNNKDANLVVGVEQQQPQPLDKKNLPLQNHSSGHF